MDAATQVRKQIGARLKDLRKRKGLSQLEVADLSGVSASHLSAVERGVYSPTTDMLAHVGAAMDVTIGDIVAGEELESLREVRDLLEGLPSSMRLAVLQQLRGIVALVKEADREARR